jgi:hypothetical protein
MNFKVPRWSVGLKERRAGSLACAAEASFFLGRFGPFAAMPKGLALPAMRQNHALFPQFSFFMDSAELQCLLAIVANNTKKSGEVFKLI